MAIQLKHRLPTGESRPWTLREIIQGRPVDRPTHPMLVHFPIAFYIGALVVDVISRIWTFPTAPLMAYLPITPSACIRLITSRVAFIPIPESQGQISNPSLLRAESSSPRPMGVRF